MDKNLLTSIFHQNGYLDGAKVKSIELKPKATNGIASEFYMANLSYSSDSHKLPNRMIIKRPLLGDRGEGEARVYEQILRGEADLPVLKCFGVVDDDPDKPLSLFFEDLSDTHYQSEWPIIPSLTNCRLAVTTLARVHAHWWGNTSSIDAGTPAVAKHQNSEHLKNFFPGFVDLVGEYLSKDRISVYENLLDRIGPLIERRQNTSNSTFLHTDSHFWNFLYPLDPNRHDCIVFDWPLWRTGLAGTDLAYMIALHLYPEHRSRFESTLLAHYHQELTECGVTYDLSDVHLDYRIGVVYGLLMPIMEFSWKVPPSDWMPKLEKALSAFDELQCQELL